MKPKNIMITDSFDNQSPAKINPVRKDNAPRVDAVILTFSNIIEDFVVNNYDCGRIGRLWMSTGVTPVYQVNYNGKHFGFFRTCVGAPACVATVEEVLCVLDTDKVILFGSAGCLDAGIARGKVMVPTEAYRDEGTSYHYAEAADFIEIRKHAAVAACMEENGIPFIKGRTWTTDAFYRETEGNIAKRKADGCISVEMEGAAVQAVCDFRKKDLFMFFTGGDLLDAPEWDARRAFLPNGKTCEKGTQHDTGHFDIALTLADYITG